VKNEQKRCLGLVDFAAFAREATRYQKGLAAWSQPLWEQEKGLQVLSGERLGPMRKARRPKRSCARRIQLQTDKLTYRIRPKDASIRRGYQLESLLNFGFRKE